MGGGGGERVCNRDGACEIESERETKKGIRRE